MHRAVTPTQAPLCMIRSRAKYSTKNCQSGKGSPSAARGKRARAASASRVVDAGGSRANARKLHECELHTEVTVTKRSCESRWMKGWAGGGGARAAG
eukprot:489021-Prorocentrum_minimum.AAC.1